MKSMTKAREDDWRPTGQEKYLQGVTLFHRQYTRWSENWDHDHCSFCMAKSMVEHHPDVLNEGYCTEDAYRWVCEQCFEDFKERFEWVVGTEGSPHEAHAT